MIKDEKQFKNKFNSNINHILNPSENLIDNYYNNKNNKENKNYDDVIIIILILYIIN